MNVKEFEELSGLLIETSFHLSFDKVPKLISLKDVFLIEDH